MLKTPEGCLFESNAIARYITTLTSNPLYPRAPFNTATAAKAAAIDKWIDFSQISIDRWAEGAAGDAASAPLLPSLAGRRRR